MSHLHFKTIFVSIGLIAIASLFYALGTAFILVYSLENLQQVYLASFVLFMPIGFIVIPFLLARNYINESPYKEVVFDWKQYTLIAATIFSINYFFIRSDEYFLQMIISISEEVLFRYIIYTIIRKNHSYRSTVLITSILFAFLLHMNYPLLDNLFIRMPFSIVFTMIATKLGLQYSIGGHWLYNLVVSKLSF